MAPVLCVFVAMGIGAMSPTKREKLQKEIPSVFGHLGCWKTATFLLSTGGSGIAFAVFFGDPVCAGTFVKLFILCCIDGGIFGWAWFKREDSMVMAAFNKMAG